MYTQLYTNSTQMNLKEMQVSSLENSKSQFISQNLTKNFNKYNQKESNAVFFKNTAVFMDDDDDCSDDESQVSTACSTVNSRYG